MCHTAEVTVFVLLWANLVMSERPAVAVVLAGDSIVLNCTENPTNWHFTPLNHTGHNGGDKDIYMGGEDLSRGVDRKVFRLTGNRTVGEVNLNITNVTFEWAGQYNCSKNLKKFLRYKLIVLENIPVCRVTTVSDDRNVLCSRRKTQHECNGSCSSPQNGELLRRAADNEFIGPNACGIPQDQILVSCSVTYFSKDIPVPELINPRDNKVIQTSCNTTKLNATIYRNRLTCNATLNATMDLDGVQFIWQTNQSKQNQYNCTTEPIKILYSIDGTQSNHQTVQLHDTLNCRANCSHPCSYKWTRSEKFGKGVLKYEECTNELMANHTGFYRCEAVCRMGKYLCEVTVKNVEVSSTTVSEQVGEQANDGLKTSVSIVVVIFTIGRLLDIWHKLI